MLLVWNGFLCSHNDCNCMCKQFGKALYLNWMIVYLRGAGGFSKSSPPYSCNKFPTGQIKHVQFAKIWFSGRTSLWLVLVLVSLQSGYYLAEKKVKLCEFTFDIQYGLENLKGCLDT
ncbi:hypothetical protein C5167_045692 [Papaver somniferum]|uniref:Uncharacterized protein n=1 Tax=Papaver somniferum TaxID=3469 RepID=A0A4Y7LBQ8_PAPSO|nr:hypothetical protein C5167_045692 [Papaver somniferum]